MNKYIRYGWNGVLLLQEITLIIFLLARRVTELQIVLVLLAFVGFCMGSVLWKPGIRLTGVVVRICIGVIITLLSGYYARELGLYLTAIGLVSLACLFDFWLEHRRRMRQVMQVIFVMVTLHFSHHHRMLIPDKSSE